MRSVFRLPDRSPRGPSLRTLSLRTRLVVLLVALAVVGLAAADLASYRALHNYLYDRVDQQLESSVAPVSMSLARESGTAAFGTTQAGPRPAFGSGEPGGPGGASPPAVVFGQLRDPAGEVVAHTGNEFFGREVAVPKLPAGRVPLLIPTLERRGRRALPPTGNQALDARTKLRQARVDVATAGGKLA